MSADMLNYKHSTVISRGQPQIVVYHTRLYDWERCWLEWCQI